MRDSADYEYNINQHWTEHPISDWQEPVYLLGLAEMGVELDL